MNGNEPRVPLEVLEPGDSDPTYWDRFQLRVIEAARSTLSHRRRASVTLGGIVVSWGRLILPLAAAAGLSALLVSGGTDPSSQGIAGVEEVLEPPDGEEPLPSFLHSDELVDRDLVLFAVEGF